MTPQDWIREQLRHWRQDLINLSRTNRLLYFKPTKATLGIVEPAATEVLQGLTGAGLSIFEPPEKKDRSDLPALSEADVPAPPPRALRPREVRTDAADRTRLLAALRNLDRRAAQEFMDKGLWILYLGVGMLEWISVEGDERERVQSPLLLVPVALHHDSLQRPYQLRRAEEDIAINPALAAKLEHDFGLNLPGADDVEDSDPEKLFEIVRQLVREHPDWRVTAKVVLGTFSFHKEVMYRDLLENEEMIVEHLLIRALALKPEESDVDLSFAPVADDRLDEEAPPEQMLTIRDADASQRKCIVAARQGRSFVMDGPPGTGKSQTIANVIAELLARGQTVLFVSEKAAALEVVHSRLQAAGIADFALALHSHKTTRREVAVELGRSLRQHPRPSRALDPFQLEGLSARRLELSAYALAVNEIRPPLGRSLNQVLGRIAQLQPLPQAPHPELKGKALDAATFVQLIAAAKALSRAWAPVERAESFLWRDLSNPVLTTARRRSLTETLAAAAAALGVVEHLTSALATEIYPPWNRSTAHAERFVTLLQHLELRRPVPATWLTEPDLDGLESRARELQLLSDRIRALASGLTALAGPQWRQLGGDNDASAIDTAVSALSNLLPLWAFDDTWGQVDLETRAEFLGSSVARLRLAAGEAGQIASAFGLRDGNASTARVRELAELGQLTGSPTPPEAGWLDLPAFATARAAATLLEQRVTEVLRHREALAAVFADSVLELELEGLCVRFETEHQGWRKLLPAHWRDRRALARSTRSGRVGRDVLGHLRGALAWAKAKERLTATEQRNAAFLGHYYEGESTDFAALDSALAVAKRALDLAGPGANQAALERSLTRRKDADTGLAPLARELRSAVEAWLEEARAWLGESTVSELSRRPLDAATAICEQGCSLLTVVSEVVGRATAITGRRLPFGTLRQILPLQAEFAKLRARLEAEAERDVSVLGPGRTWMDAEWEEILQSLGWLRRLREILGDSSPKPIDQALSRRLYATTAAAGPVVEALAHWRRLRDTLGAEFTGGYREQILAEAESSFRGGDALLAGLRDSVDDITTWDAFARTCAALEAAGLQVTTQFAIERKVQGLEVAGVIERAILEHWADEVLGSDSRLQNIRPEDRDAFVREFQELDREFVRAAAGRVIESCNGRRPTTDAGVSGTIQFEAQKRRKHMPVHRLLAATQAVVQALKPCFMMSPLTVSQFLPAAMKFDVVIFDEASQVRPADAINCIYRGRRLIVAGDQKQLPPTTFFETVALDGEDEWEENELADFDSVLDLCQAHGFPSLTLRWHYRSQHEDLITFSNYSFYDGRLLTFPGALHSAPDLGVELFRVPGIYRRGGARDNPVEARKVVERVLFHSLNHPSLSVGVVAFSEAQATAIQDAIEAARIERPELQQLLDTADRLRGFFVKNLETVQGDERDILIFSIGYGPDENGKFTKQLGPLSRKGGERRLNVAITRARRRVEVIASIGADDLAGDLGSDGLRHLKRYLDYAGRTDQKVRALAFDVSATAGDVESPFEDEVARVVRSWGHDVVAQVGCAGYRIDLAVLHPERPGAFALGIECDGAAYHSSPVARDRDRLRQEILIGLGWRLYRIWGSSWYRNRGDQEIKLRQAIEAAMTAPPPVLQGLASPPTPTVQLDAVDLDSPPAWTVPYKIASPGPPRPGLEMHEARAQSELCRMIAEVVGIEGPAHQKLVLRRVREAWGLQRAGTRIQEAFDRALGWLRRGAGISSDEAGFLAITGDRMDAVRTPTDDARSHRDVVELPHVELALAVDMLVNDARSITADELTARVARLFGWNRRGPEIAKALGLVVQSCLNQGSLLAEGPMLRPGKPAAGD
jgi:hypothetical protein